jgi:hypothetical protein
MALQPGTWNVAANGSVGLLVVANIDPNGAISRGSTLFDDPIVGFWDEPAQKLFFMRTNSSGNPETYQVFTGYVMTNRSVPTPTIAGSFEAFAGNGGEAQRTSFGWYAIPQPLIS